MRMIISSKSVSFNLDKLLEQMHMTAHNKLSKEEVVELAKGLFSAYVSNNTKC